MALVPLNLKGLDIPLLHCLRDLLHCLIRVVQVVASYSLEELHHLGRLRQGPIFELIVEAINEDGYHPSPVRSCEVLHRVMNCKGHSLVIGEFMSYLHTELTQVVILRVASREAEGVGAVAGLLVLQVMVAVEFVKIVSILQEVTRVLEADVAWDKGRWNYDDGLLLSTSCS